MTFYKIIPVASLTLLAGLTLNSCVEDTDGRPQIGPGNPVATKIMPDSAAGGSVVTLTGTGLGDIRTIVFEKQNVPAGFQPTLNTDGAIIFRVPTEASGGIDLRTIGPKAATGVTYVSVGRLTQSAPAADIGLDFTPL